MKPTWKRFAPFGLYLALIAGLVGLGFYIVQREFSLGVQISLGLVVVGLALFAILDPQRLRAGLTGRQARYGSNALILFLAFSGILVVVNYLVYKNPKRWDLTEGQQLSLAPETIDTLKNLPQPVQVLAFYTAGNSSGDADSLLDQYKFNGNGKVDYRFIDPNQDPLTAQQYQISRDGTLVLTMGGNTQQVTLVNENELTGALIRLISPGEHVVYFLTGHGEMDPLGSGERSYSQAKTTLEAKNYTVRPLNLLSENQIPQDAEVIVIAGPMKPLSQQEVDLLSAYLDGGGSLVVMEEPLPVTDFSDQADPLADFLASSWGINLGKDMVLDLSSNQPFVAVANQYGQHVITDKLQGLVTIYPTARSVSSVEGGDKLPVVLVLTSQNSWAETDLQALASSAGSDTQPQIQPDEGVDLLGPVPLAVSAEDQVSRARLVVFGDSEFGSDAFIGQYGNQDMLINSIDWAAEQEQLINLTPKENVQRMLLPPGPYTMNLILLGSVFILPGIILLAGVFVWVGRRRKG
jgi:ABC-type uncharacterized transport system involved in gliding motility auxiliary subunit